MDPLDLRPPPTALPATAATSRLEAGGPSANPALARAAEQFEAMVLAQMLAPVFAGLKTDGLGGGGFGEEMFRPFLSVVYAKGVPLYGGVGLAASLVRELSRLHVVATEPDAPAADLTPAEEPS